MMIEKNSWTSIEFLGLLVIPIEFLLGIGLSKLPFIGNTPWVAVSLSLCIFLTGFLITIYLFKNFLKKEWRLYRKDKFWLKLGINILLVGGAFALLTFARTISISNLSINDNNQLSTSSLGLILLASLQPFIALDRLQ